MGGRRPRTIEMPMHLMQDFRYAVRLLRRTPGFTAVAVLVLALGIGANTAAFSLVNALLLQPRPGRIDSVVGVFNRDRLKPDAYRDFSYPAYEDLRARGDVFESLMAHSFAMVGIREGERTRRSFVTLVSANYFSTLGVRLAAGRPFTLEEERPGARPPVVIASYAAWRRAGFDPAFVGRTVRVNALDVTIVGVAPRAFGGTMTLVAFEWFFPLGLYDSIVNDMFKPKATGLNDRGNHAINLAGVLKPGVTAESAARPLDQTAARLGAEFPATDRDRQFQLARLQRLGISSAPEGESELSLVSGLLTAMAGLVLIVACLNLANLLLARGAARRREIAIRQALGSGRRRIVSQLLVEGFTLSAAGSVLGLALSWWTTSALAVGITSALPLDVVVEPSGRVFAAAAAFAVLSTLLFALGPAWTLSRQTVTSDLKGQTMSAVRKTRTGPALIVAQLAVSLALVATGGLFVRGAIKAGSADPGFALDHQLLFSMDASMAGYDEGRTRALYRRILDRMAGFPGVESAALASIVSFGELSENRYAYVPGVTTGFRPQFLIVTSSYFDTLRLPILRGRALTPADDEPSTRRPIPAVVDVALARRMFGGGDSLGRRIQIAVREATPPVDFDIVGVVPTTRHDLFESEPMGHVYAPYGSQFRANMNLHVRTAAAVDDTAMLSAIQREIRGVDAGLPVLTARTMTAHRDVSIPEWSVRTAATLFSTVGGLALLIAAIGLYGLKAYDVSRRTREIGIRIALGASSRNVVGLVLRDGARTTLIGLGIGLALAAAIGKLVSSLLYQVSPFDPAVLMAAAVILASAAMLACYVPARRATRIEPLEALRVE
jgi:putative ABC transport system permease protein